MTTAAAVRWTDLAWQLIASERLSPAANIALDRVLLDAVASGARPPLLRFWDWDAACLVIGRFQSLANEADLDAARQLDVQVVRRFSGGGAMFMEPGKSITWSLYLPETLVAGMSFADSYAFLDAWVVDALRALGLDVFYRPLNDIASSQGKIAGAAQLRSRGAVLHHVTLAWQLDNERMCKVLRLGRARLSGRGIASAEKWVDALGRQTTLTPPALIGYLQEAFRSRHGLATGQLTAEERRLALALAAEKVATPAWTALVP